MTDTSTALTLTLTLTLADFAPRIRIRILSIARCHAVTPAGMLALARGTSSHREPGSSHEHPGSLHHEHRSSRQQPGSSRRDYPPSEPHSQTAASSLLEALCVSGLDAVNNQTLAALAWRCVRLRRLEAAGCVRVGGAGLVALAGGCPLLGLVDGHC